MTKIDFCYTLIDKISDPCPDMSVYTYYTLKCEGELYKTPFFWKSIYHMLRDQLIFELGPDQIYGINIDDGVVTVSKNYTIYTVESPTSLPEQIREVLSKVWIYMVDSTVDMGPSVRATLLRHEYTLLNKEEINLLEFAIAHRYDDDPT